MRVPAQTVHRSKVLGAVVLAATFAADASAACPAPYTVDGLLADLLAAEGAIKGGDAGAAGTLAAKMEASLPCLDAALPRPIAGKSYRAIGGGYVVGGNNGKGEDWLRTAAELEPSFVYGVEDLPDGHPVRVVYDAAKTTAGGDEVIVGAITGEIVVDGRKQTTQAKARPDRPHLVQVNAGSGFQGWLVEGTAFPPEVVPKGSAGSRPDDAASTKPPKPAKPPKGGEVVAGKPEPEPKAGKPPKPTTVGSNGVAVVKRKRPWEKTPLLIGGSAIVLGGVGVYGLSFAARNDFEGAKSIEDLDQFRKVTNTYFVSSLAVVGVGIGTFTWGAILSDSGPVAGVHLQF